MASKSTASMSIVKRAASIIRRITTSLRSSLPAAANGFRAINVTPNAQITPHRAGHNSSLMSKWSCAVRAAISSPFVNISAPDQFVRVAVGNSTPAAPDIITSISRLKTSTRLRTGLPFSRALRRRCDQAAIRSAQDRVGRLSALRTRRVR